ncbi:MAG: ABC transporter ATP-binding protein [Steroidobacteraceae bacterium]
MNNIPLFCDGIGKSYAGRQVLKDIRLSVPRGGVLGLIGRNGAGKTTLIRILMGLQHADRGEARLCGESPLRLTDNTRQQLGYVPQQPDALAWMRVGDMLDFIGSFYAQWDSEFVRNALQRWQIDPKQPLAKLSPGERQRVALIRALASRPQLLVLDEPAAALDPVARRDLLREIAQRAADQGTTVLFSTHIVSDLERVASHLAFLHEGSLILDTTMDELKETHARLVLPASAATTLTGLLPGELRRRSLPDGGLSLLLTRSPGSDWPAATHLPGARLDVLGLEDLFVEVTE